MQGAVGLGRVKPEAQLTQVALSSPKRDAIEIERAKFRLRVGQDIFHGRKLDQVARIAWAKAYALPAIDHGAPQPQRDGGNAVRKSHGLHGIEVVRAHHTREIGIEALTV